MEASSEFEEEALREQEILPKSTQSDGTSQTESQISEDGRIPLNAEAVQREDAAFPQTETESGSKARGQRKISQAKTQPGDERRQAARVPLDHDDRTTAVQPPKSQAGKYAADILAIDQRRTVVTESDQEESNLLDLLESKKTGRILTDTIIGVEHTAGNRSHSYAVINHGTYKVIIPALEVIDPPEDLHGHSAESVMHFLLSKRLGAEVDYVVKEVDAENCLAVASRLEAMRAKRKHYYLTAARNGGAIIRPGLRAEARVVSVVRSGIYIDLFGVETFIPMRELSYQRFVDAATAFQTGQRTLVKILNVDCSDRNNIRVEASVKQAANNPFEKALRNYKTGNCYIGTVSMVNSSGIFVALDGGVDCLCSLTKRGRPPIGSRATVRILGIDSSSKRIWGAILYFAG